MDAKLWSAGVCPAAKSFLRLRPDNTTSMHHQRILTEQEKKRTNRFQCHFRITPPEWTNGIHLLRQTMEDLKISHFLLYKNWFMTEKGENCWILLQITKLVDLCGFFFAGTFIVYVIRALVRLVHSSRLLVQKPVHKTWPFLFHFKVYAHLFFALDWVAHFMVLLELH